mgnify:FL=1
MEDIFIQALITRSYNETDLLDKLPEDVKLMVEEKLSTEVQNNEIPELP